MTDTKIGADLKHRGVAATKLMTGAPLLRPIETRYRGYRFRSRFEARWAVFFETLGVPWKYEPEGFALPSGARYLPDFRLRLFFPESFWIEVKPTGGDTSLFKEFCQTLPVKRGWQPRAALLTEIPDPLLRDLDGDYDGFLVLGASVSEWILARGPFWPIKDHDFAACKRCGAVGFAQFGWAVYICNCGLDGENDSPRVERAYRAARSARFEHGERG